MPSPTRMKFWNDEVKRDYWHQKKVDQDRAHAERSGQMIADKMDEVLADLLVDECEFIEFMVLSRTQTVIAKFDIDVLKRLVSRRLLQLRPGVGTMFMQNYQTSFSIPDAVWNALTTRHQTACDSGGRSVRARIRILKNRLGATLDGIVPIPPSASDT